MTEFIHRRFRYCRKHGQYRTWITRSEFYSIIEPRTPCDLKQPSLQQIYQIVPALREKLKLRSVFLYIIKRFELTRTFTGHCCKSGLSTAVSFGPDWNGKYCGIVCIWPWTVSNRKKSILRSGPPQKLIMTITRGAVFCSDVLRID